MSENPSSFQRENDDAEDVEDEDVEEWHEGRDEREEIKCGKDLFFISLIFFSIKFTAAQVNPGFLFREREGGSWLNISYAWKIENRSKEMSDSLWRKNEKNLIKNSFGAQRTAHEHAPRTHVQT